MATRNNSGSNEPYLSILVISYSMANQLANTLFTLGTDYQRDIDENDYEVIVVENESDDVLSADKISSLPINFQYHRRPNDSVSPVSAIEFGLKRCRGKILGMIIDGAQMITPQVLKYTLWAFKITEDALVAVPGYHLGEVMQHEVTDCEAFLGEQTKFLSNTNWQSNGYRLFDWACFSPGNKNGFLHPLMESNVFFCLKENFLAIEGADHRFQFPGGGAINLHLYRKLGLLRKAKLFILPGEGTFHQYHAGVTTTYSGDYEEKIAEFNVQLQDIWDQDFNALRREPALLGKISQQAQHFLLKSCEMAQRRFNRLQSLDLPIWEDDVPEKLTQ